MGAAAEFLSEVMDEGSDVGAFGAGDAEGGEGFFVGIDLERVDMDEAFLAFYFDAFAGEFIEGHAILFYGGDHGGELHLVADEGLGGVGDFLEGHEGDGEGGEEFAVGVVAAGCFAEFESAFVDFVIGHESFGEAGGFTEDEDEEAGGIGVQGAAVADLFDSEFSADSGDHVMGGGAGGFIDEEGAVEGGECEHGAGRFGVG
ncbi:MAG: hypothetical protein RI897_3152 [Verrucomicrobiota bacterium]